MRSASCPALRIGQGGGSAWGKPIINRDAPFGVIQASEVM